jgi:hypothetical protein
VRETADAAAAIGAYLTTVLPRARRELRQLGPLLREKERNAEAVAVFAIMAPRSARAEVVRAIIALQIAIDLKDEIEEKGGDRGLQAARLEGLEARWRGVVEALPSQAAVLPLIESAVERCEQGQLHTHRAALEGPEPLRRWTSGLKAPANYRWWEVAAGASSSVAAHALIAAAADPSTSGDTAALIDAVYYPPVGALTVLLDDLVDREADCAAGEHNYLAYYESPDEAAERLSLIASRAEAFLAHLPRPSRHRAILAGVAAFYLGDNRASTSFAHPIRKRMLTALGPSTRLLSAFTRLRNPGGRKRPGQAGNSPGP